MAKRPGSKGSRSERRAGKDRALRARERGLPERAPEPLRVRAATPDPRSAEGEDRSSDAPPVGGAKSSALPPWVWVAGIALALLGGAYVLSTQRDEALTKPEPEAPAASSAVLESSAPSPEAAASEAPSAAPAPPEPSTPELSPSAGADVAPPASAVAPVAPTVEKPVAPKSAAPKVAKPAVAPVAAPTTVPPPAAPVPAAPPASPTKPADNPY